MTRIVYENLPVIFETNGDCSSLTLTFPNDAVPLVTELRQKFKAHGFLVQEEFINDNMLRILPPRDNSTTDDNS